MQEQSLETLKSEEDRIQAAYARRQENNRYSLFNPGSLFMAQELERVLLALLKRYDFETLGTTKILEVGCGTGYRIREFIKWGARPENVVGIDLLSDSVARARQSCPSTVRIDCGSAAHLALPDATFDLVFQATVFTSILNADMKQQIASEMLRVLKDDGLIFWYDYHVSNPWNHDVRGVKKREIYQLFPHCLIKLRRITLIPYITWRLAPYSWMSCYILSKIPWLCTHYLGVIKKLRR